MIQQNFNNFSSASGGVNAENIKRGAKNHNSQQSFKTGKLASGPKEILTTTQGSAGSTGGSGGITPSKIIDNFLLKKREREKMKLKDFGKNFAGGLGGEGADGSLNNKENQGAINNFLQVNKENIFDKKIFEARKQKDAGLKKSGQKMTCNKGFKTFGTAGKGDSLAHTNTNCIANTAGNPKISGKKYLGKNKTEVRCGSNPTGEQCDLDAQKPRKLFEKPENLDVKSIGNRTCGAGVVGSYSEKLLKKKNPETVISEMTGFDGFENGTEIGNTTISSERGENSFLTALKKYKHSEFGVMTADGQKDSNLDGNCKPEISKNSKKIFGKPNKSTRTKTEFDISDYGHDLPNTKDNGKKKKYLNSFLLASNGKNCANTVGNVKSEQMALEDDSEFNGLDTELSSYHGTTTHTINCGDKYFMFYNNKDKSVDKIRGYNRNSLKDEQGLNKSKSNSYKKTSNFDLNSNLNSSELASTYMSPNFIQDLSKISGQKADPKPSSVNTKYLDLKSKIHSYKNRRNTNSSRSGSYSTQFTKNPNPKNPTPPKKPDTPTTPHQTTFQQSIENLKNTPNPNPNPHKPPNTFTSTLNPHPRPNPQKATTPKPHNNSSKIDQTQPKRPQKAPSHKSSQSLSILTNNAFKKNITANLGENNKFLPINNEKKRTLCFQEAIENIEREKLGGKIGVMSGKENFCAENGDLEGENLNPEEIAIVGNLREKIYRQEELLKDLVSKLGDLRSEAAIYEERFEMLLDENKQLNGKVVGLDSQYQINKQIINNIRSNFGQN